MCVLPWSLITLVTIPDQVSEASQSRMTLVRPLLLPLLGLGLLAMVREDQGGGGGSRAHRAEEGTEGNGQKVLIQKGGKGPVLKDGKVEQKGGKLGKPGGMEGRTGRGANQGALGRTTREEKRPRKEKTRKSKARNKKVKQSKVPKRKIKQKMKRLGGQGNVENKKKTKQKDKKKYKKKQTKNKNKANKTKKKKIKRVETKEQEAKQDCNFAQMVPKFALFSFTSEGKASSISKQVGPSYIAPSIHVFLQVKRIEGNDKITQNKEGKKRDFIE